MWLEWDPVKSYSVRVSNLSNHIHQSNIKQGHPTHHSILIGSRHEGCATDACQPEYWRIYASVI